MDCKEKILSENVRDLILEYTLAEEVGEQFDYCSVNLDDLYQLIYVNQIGLDPITEAPYEYLNTPRLYGLTPIVGGSGGIGFDPVSLTASGILQVQRQPLHLTGRGVIVVLIDGGVDTMQPVFRNEDGSTRILELWDQTIQTGTPPEGFLYGTLITKEQLDTVTQQQVQVTETQRHGTSMLSVATGRSETYLGAAPDAELAVVKLKQCKQYLRDYYLLPQDVPAYEEQDIMLAVKYADSLADKYERPVVICLGIGTNMGAHSGSSSLDRYLERIAEKRNRTIVVGGGDEGNAAHHYSNRVRGAEGSGFQDVEIRVGEDCRGFVMEFWGGVPDIYNISIRTPGGETVPPARLNYGQSVTYRFIYEASRVTVSSVLVEPVTGEELFTFRIEEPSAGIWTFRVSAVEPISHGIFHMWLPLVQFLTAEVYFLEPDPYTTLTEPSVSDHVITVSAYNDLNNSFFVESGRGFTRTGVIKPDFAAPGVNVSTVYGKQTGSALAAAMSAGAVAQFLQWAVLEKNNEYIDSTELRNYLIRGASRDTGNIYPNREMGYGRLNLAGTFDVLARV